VTIQGFTNWAIGDDYNVTHKNGLFTNHQVQYFMGIGKLCVTAMTHLLKGTSIVFFLPIRSSADPGEILWDILVLLDEKAHETGWVNVKGRGRGHGANCLVK